MPRHSGPRRSPRHASTCSRRSRRQKLPRHPRIRWPRIRALRSRRPPGRRRLILTSGPDPELSEKATAVTGLVEAELSKVVLLGAPPALVDEVLGRPRAGSPLVSWRELEGVDVYGAAAAARCTGHYVVGASSGARSLAGKEPGLLRLLSQATGRPLKGIQPPLKSAKEHETSRWARTGPDAGARPLGRRHADGAADWRRCPVTVEASCLREPRRARAGMGVPRR